MIKEQIKRIYPIRTTRNKWNIPLFSCHKCNTNCNIMLITENNSENYFFKENPNYKDGKCSMYDKINKSFIRLTDFDINNPTTEDGILINPDNKVIADNSFKLLIYFPLSYVFEVRINAPEFNGFTLSQLIYSIKNLYEFIYKEEERTSNPQIYNLKKVCSSCGNEDLSKYVLQVQDEKKYISEQCCICYSSYENKENKAITLKCNHIFHDTCIKEWLQKSGTCPLCRSTIFECNKCDGTGIIYYTFTGIVIPLEHRGSILNRNRTDGLYGIHSYDLEDLLIENLFYDNQKKQLYMDITS